MRLLKFDSLGELSLTDDLTKDIPRYAILSHTWGAGGDEVTFTDLQSGSSKGKAGYNKIRFCGEKVRKDGLEHFWVDTCCINKSDIPELQRAITSMFRWYRDTEKCYVYLSDVSTHQDSMEKNERTQESAFRQSRWFKRGWTLQELIAPRSVEFFSQEEDCLGNKSTLEQQIHEITGIPIAALRGAPLSGFSVYERLRWAEKRETKWEEDKAYCLLGIFDISMSLRYGEGGNALTRLKAKIEKPSRIYEGHEDLSFREPAGICLGQAPYIDPELFIGRASELDHMQENLVANEKSQPHRRLVLGGKGGIGKTQLAVAYAIRHCDDYTSIFWLNATSEATLKGSFRLIAERIFDIRDSGVLEVEQIVKQVHRWLSDRNNTQRLLIFDNYDDPGLFNISQYYPAASHGAILITTRRPGLVAGKELHIEPLEQIDESLAILETRSQRKDTRTDAHARRLAERLGGLPLALATAGAYLQKSSFTFERYLREYEKRWNIDPRRHLQLQEYQDRTLYTTWDLSYIHLESEDPDAAKLLKLLAYFDNQFFGYELFHPGVGGGSPKWLHEVMTDDVNFASVMRTLIDYCFIEVQKIAGREATDSWSMHNCVHDWTLAALNKVIDAQNYWYAFDCVVGSINKEDWEIFGHLSYARLAAHATRLVQDRFWLDDLIDDTLPDRLGEASIVADLLRYQTRFIAAERMLLRTLAGMEKALGAEHTSTLKTINNLGMLYQEQGKLAQAEQYYQQALAGMEKALGPEHMSTLSTVGNLGNLYRDQGKLAHAEQYYQRALAGKEKALGPEHTSTLSTFNNLGILYKDQGKLVQAEQYYLRALAGKEKALGPEHISTLRTVNNLGILYKDQGKLVHAEQYYQRALAGKEKALGPEHTSTLSTVNNLGNLYKDQGKLVQAEQYYQQALAGMEKALGPEHMSTLSTVGNLGNLYKDQGKLVQAEQYYLQALAGMERALGPEHVLTLQMVNNLGILYEDQGKLAQAEQYYLLALAGKEKALGPEHMSTLRTVNNLGILYKDQGKLSQADQYYQRTLDGMEKALGPEHISTLRTVNKRPGQAGAGGAVLSTGAAGKERMLQSNNVPALNIVSNLELFVFRPG